MFRAMLRSLLSHKLRLLLSALAVVLGTMFMSAAFVAGDTMAKGFQELFTTVNQNVDVQVTAKDDAPGEVDSGTPTALLDQSTVDKVAAVPGVAKFVPGVYADGARVVGKDGKVLSSTGPPRAGTGWVDNDGLSQMREGRPPQTADEIAIDAGLAKKAGYGIGDRVDVLTLKARKTYSVVGIFGYQGGRDSLAGEMTVAFTMSTAQEVMLDAPGKFTQIDLRAASGVSDAELKHRVADALGSKFVVRTGEETAEEQQNQVSGFITVLKTGLVVFAIIGLFTGAFLIFNTFSMLVAQRTRELALYRSFGASRGQVNRSVLIESVLLGLVSSLVGLAVGIGVGYGLKQLLESFSNANLPFNGVEVRPYAVIWTLVVGTGFTLVAALVPAMRASRVPPIAAMRDAATPDKPLGQLTVAGAVVAAIGAGLLALALTDTGDLNLGFTLGGGTGLAFLGVAMMAPVISRPITGALGRLLSWSMPGRLGTRNTGRNPRRTAATAAALMIGVALATGGGVFASSAKAGIKSAFEQDLSAQLLVATDNNASAQAGFDPALGEQMRAIPGVDTVFVGRGDYVSLGGKTRYVYAGDPAAAKVIFNLETISGQIDELHSGQVIIPDGAAKNDHLKVGDTLPMQTARGGTKPATIVGVFKATPVMGNALISDVDGTGFRSPLAQAAFVKTAPDQVAQVKTALAAMVKDNPEVTVNDQSDIIDQTDSAIDIVLAIINVLLGLAILVAVLGVINTLLLSVFERTRELGMVRAIGMSRMQVARMVTVESVLISVFGALLGMAVGVGLALAVITAIGGEFLTLTVSWGYLLTVLVLAVIAGVIAAVLPAIKAARLNVLNAIAYE
jgi:putative ABC transport system permease protein